ncbi:MAG: hypothetical protein JSV01_10210 [Desulfobacterales bacterium]|nr:MAG: hypothetical protein JSV01_10210 [Desulfobacterales bacterium]
MKDIAYLAIDVYARLCECWYYPLQIFSNRLWRLIRVAARYSNSFIDRLYFV